MRGFPSHSSMNFTFSQCVTRQLWWCQISWNLVKSHTACKKLTVPDVMSQLICWATDGKMIVAHSSQSRSARNAWHLQMDCHLHNAFHLQGHALLLNFFFWICFFFVSHFPLLALPSSWSCTTVHRSVMAFHSEKDGLCWCRLTFRASMITFGPCILNTIIKNNRSSSLKFGRCWEQ